MRQSYTPSMSIEALEPRALLSLPTATFVSHATSDTGLFVTVDYFADQGLDESTLGAGDLQATATGQPTLTSELFGTPTSQLDGSVRAIYLLAPSNGAWNHTNSGLYTITSPAGQVKDLSNQNLANGNITTLNLSFSQPRTTIPSVTVTATDWQIVVNYTDDTAIDLTTLGNADLSIEGPELLTGITFQYKVVTSPGNVSAVYRVPAPKGAWTYLDTGHYDVVLNNHQVSDTSGNFNGLTQVRTFSLWFDKPAAQLFSGTTVRSADWLVPIKFSGLSAIDPFSFSNGAVTVTGPNGFSQNGQFYQLLNHHDGSYTATFRFTAPGGIWDYSDNGQYRVITTASRIKDINNRYVPSTTLKSFGLGFNNPNAEHVVAGYAVPAEWFVTVRFSDNGSVNQSTISANAIRIVGPIATNISLLSITADPVSGYRAKFRITAASGVLVNGFYTLWTNPNQVHDNQNYFVREGPIRTFGLAF